MGSVSKLRHRDSAVRDDPHGCPSHNLRLARKHISCRNMDESASTHLCAALPSTSRFLSLIDDLSLSFIVLVILFFSGFAMSYQPYNGALPNEDVPTQTEEVARPLTDQECFLLFQQTNEQYWNSLGLSMNHSNIGHAQVRHSLLLTIL